MQRTSQVLECLEIYFKEVMFITHRYTNGQKDDLMHNPKANFYRYHKILILSVMDNYEVTSGSNIAITVDTMFHKKSIVR